MEEYKVNENFKSFLDKFCEKHNLTVEQALKHRQVINAENYYKAIRWNKERIK